MDRKDSVLYVSFVVLLFLDVLVRGKPTYLEGNVYYLVLLLGRSKQFLKKIAHILQCCIFSASVF